MSSRMTLIARLPSIMGLLAVLFLLQIFMFSAPVYAEQANCLGCHKETDDLPIHAIWQTPHGKLADGLNASCTSCHGASPEHGKVPTKNPPTVSFGPKWPSAPEEQTASCMNCHKKQHGATWMGSAHEQEQLSCSSCHNAHIANDPVLDPALQTATCFSCHTDVRSAAHLQSRHPILEGKTACIDCHNPHGSLTDYSLIQPTLNDTCFQCHEEKRGPFLFEHTPVTEDCGSCHSPHGSVNDNLLSTRTPFLCQQCHSSAFHPSQQLDGSGLPGQGASQYLLGKNCLNCHQQVHGSNHPSGSKLTR